MTLGLDPLPSFRNNMQHQNKDNAGSGNGEYPDKSIWSYVQDTTSQKGVNFLIPPESIDN